MLYSDFQAIQLHNSIRYELRCCMEKCVDPEQLASLEAGQTGALMFSIDYIPGLPFDTVF